MQAPGETPASVGLACVKTQAYHPAFSVFSNCKHRSHKRIHCFTFLGQTLQDQSEGIQGGGFLLKLLDRFILLSFQILDATHSLAPGLSALALLQVPLVFPGLGPPASLL